MFEIKNKMGSDAVNLYPAFNFGPQTSVVTNP
jgi:hypothetical protein